LGGRLLAAHDGALGPFAGTGRRAAGGALLRPAQLGLRLAVGARLGAAQHLRPVLLALLQDAVELLVAEVLDADELVLGLGGADPGVCLAFAERVVGGAVPERPWPSLPKPLPKSSMARSTPSACAPKSARRLRG